MWDSLMWKGPCGDSRPRLSAERSSACGKIAQRMRKNLISCLAVTLLLTSCSPREILSLRLAADLIAASDAFKITQQYTLQTGVLANKDYVSPEYLILQHHGWISATSAACAQGLGPPPCWEVILTPSGVETVRSVVSPDEPAKTTFAIPVAKRQLVAVTGISKQGIVADIDFSWKWVPLNEIGAALYSGDVRYRSTVRFREYDDGWRIVASTPQPPQTLDDALKNAEPAP